MNIHSSNIYGHNNVMGNPTQNGQPASKWLAIVNDQLIPMPERRVKVASVREQAGIPKDHALLRDHNSPHDVVIADNGIVDLSEGNVFYTEPLCDVKSRP